MTYDEDAKYDEPIGNPEDYDNNCGTIISRESYKFSEEQIEKLLKIKKEIKEKYVDV